MEDNLCTVCQTKPANRRICKCGELLCKECTEHLTGNAVNPHCPTCNSPLPHLSSPYESPSKTELSRKRVIQRNLVYIVGIPPSLADESLLQKTGNFGQYGHIRKCVVDKANPYNSPQGLSYRAYITYTNEIEATLCLKACDGFKTENMRMKATYGTTKYCSYFLNRTKCPKPDCLYLHEIGSRLDSFTREEITRNQHMEPHNSIFQLLKVVVSPPNSDSRLPSATVLRKRNYSEDLLVPPSRERLYSMLTPPRKNSRFGFNENSTEDAAETPKFLEELCSNFSPGEKQVKLPAEQASELLKEPWAGDVIRVDDSVQEEQLVLIKAT